MWDRSKEFLILNKGNTTICKNDVSMIVNSYDESPNSDTILDFVSCIPVIARHVTISNAYHKNVCAKTLLLYFY